MAQEADVPPNFMQKIEKLISDKIGEYARSAPLRNASISAGGRLKIKHPDGKWLMLMGSYDGPDESFLMPDGSQQPMALIWRADGTLAFGMFDSNPSNGFQQFLGWFDRGGNIVVSDDTDSGQGLARPYIPIGLQRANLAEMPKTTSATFVDLELGDFYRQHPKAFAFVNAGCDASGTTGEVRVLVDDQQVGSIISLGFAVGVNVVGPFVVPGEHMSQHRITVQARRTAGTGNVCAATSVLGVQS